MQTVRREEVRKIGDIHTGEFYELCYPRMQREAASIVKALSVPEQLTYTIVSDEFGPYGLAQYDWIFRALIVGCMNERLEKEEQEIQPIALVKGLDIYHLIVETVH